MVSAEHQLLARSIVPPERRLILRPRHHDAPAQVPAPRPALNTVPPAIPPPHRPLMLDRIERRKEPKSGPRGPTRPDRSTRCRGEIPSATNLWLSACTSPLRMIGSTRRSSRPRTSRGSIRLRANQSGNMGRTPRNTERSLVSADRDIRTTLQRTNASSAPPLRATRKSRVRTAGAEFAILPCRTRRAASKSATASRVIRYPSRADCPPFAQALALRSRLPGSDTVPAARPRTTSKASRITDRTSRQA